MLARLRRPTEAISQYHEMLDLFPNHTQTLYNLANTYKKTGKLEEAKTYFERTLSAAFLESKSTPGEESAMLAAASTNLGNVLQMQGDYEGAVGKHRLPMAISPDTPDAPFNLGVSAEPA
jgi:tetratricopeptide (TPR) repeat protein